MSNNPNASTTQPKQYTPISIEEAHETLRKIADWRKKLTKLEAKIRSRYEGENAQFKDTACYYSTDPSWHMADRRRRQLLKMQDEVWARWGVTREIEAAKKHEQ
jgi:hypothetical protein